MFQGENLPLTDAVLGQYIACTSSLLPEMHFRVRKNVIQLVRTTYDGSTKKPRAAVVGRMPLDNPALTAELTARLSEAEIAETQTWIGSQHRVAVAREELAALTLAETLELANRWYLRNGDAAVASAAAAQLLPQWQALRKTLKNKGFLG